MVKSPDVIERMRRAGRVAAEVLAAVGAQVRPGVTTDELDALAHDRVHGPGRVPEPAQLQRLPQVVCTSVNEVICHGIPDDRALVDGDIVNLDVTVYLDGVHGDTNATFLVGTVDDASPPAGARSPGSASTWASPRCGRGGRSPTSARPSRPTPRPTGCGVVRDFVGHGDRRAVPHRPARSSPLRNPRPRPSWSRA